jgi:hypothetical protein
MHCGRRYEIRDYLQEIDPALWKKLSERSCLRA